MKFLDGALSTDTPYEGDLLFNRKEYGNSLKAFINNIEDGCVISINGKWGEGKTTFVKWWYEDLRKSDFVPVYFDAFKHDFYGEPFLAITKALFNQFPDDESQSPNVKAALKKLSEELIPSLLTFLTMAGATIAFGPMGTATSAVTTIGTNSLGEVVKKFLSKKETKPLECLIEEFKDTLNSITTELYLKQKRLVFIIDELDRCRPTFAVETIEKVKHLFAVPGIVWVLVMNKKQLEKSIHHVYGTGALDASKYLNKFIDIQTALPKDIKGGYSSLDHYRKLFDGLKPSFRNSIINQGYDALLVSFSKVLQLSIREVKKVLLYCELLFGTNTNYVKEYVIIGIFISAIKVHDDQSYNLIRNKNTSINNLRRNDAIAQLFKEPLVESMVWYLHFAITPEEKRPGAIDFAAAKTMGLLEIESEYENFQQFCREKVRSIDGANDWLGKICEKLDLFEFSPKNGKV
jgi:hypothetical protein